MPPWWRSIRQTGMIELLDFAVAEDCGTMINPMIVEGQVRGGVVQGIGTALYEEIPYDEQGQPLVGTLADYLVPGAAELPAIKIAHLHTPTPYTEYGVKGMGEGGAIAPPAAIANAVRDALASLGAEVNETPLTPRRVLAAIRRAQRRLRGLGCRPRACAGTTVRGAQKNASVRISMLSRGRALGGEVGSSKAVWADQRARPSFSES